MQPSPRGVWFVVFTYGSKASISENLQSRSVLHTSPPSKCDTISKIFGLGKSYVPSSDTFNYFYRPYARYVVLLKKSQAEQKFTF